MSDIKFIEGGIFTDYRGQISHVNDLDMQEIKRFYIIHQKDTSIIRAWHAHQHEKKWFYVVKGSFTTAFVKIMDCRRSAAAVSLISGVSPARMLLQWPLPIFPSPMMPSFT